MSKYISNDSHITKINFDNFHNIILDSIDYWKSHYASKEMLEKLYNYLKKNDAHIIPFTIKYEEKNTKEILKMVKRKR